MGKETGSRERGRQTGPQVRRKETCNEEEGHLNSEKGREVAVALSLDGVECSREVCLTTRLVSTTQTDRAGGGGRGQEADAKRGLREGKGFERIEPRGCGAAEPPQGPLAPPRSEPPERKKGQSNFQRSTVR